MAARVGLVAVRDVSVEEFLESFPMLEVAKPSTSGGWTWASFSLFQVTGLVGPRAEARLAGLEHAGLQAWTEDGALWRLAIHAPGRKPFRHLHWFRFNHVAAGREKLKRGLTLAGFVQDHESYLSEEYLLEESPLPKGPARRAMGVYLGQRAAAISDALEQCGVRHEREAIRGAITGETVTEEEWGWDVGNLPRFLEGIGLGDVFADWRDEIESEKRADEEARATAQAVAQVPPSDPVEAILHRLGSAKPVLIDDGPVTTTLAALWLLPWSCHNDVEMAWIVRPSRPVKPRWPKLDGLSVTQRDGEWRIAQPWCSVAQRARLVAKLEEVLAKLPAGSEIELISADIPEPEDSAPPVTAGDMRFRVERVDRAWHITHAHPPAGARDLAAALEIFEWVGARGPFKARDAAEAGAVIELSHRGRYFGTEEKDQPVVVGRDIKLGSRTWRPYLAMAVFRHRFTEGPWDTRSSHHSDEEYSANWDRLIADLGAKFSQALAAPREQEIVHQGERSVFRSARMEDLKSRTGVIDLFRALYPDRDLGPSLDLPEAMKLVDESMAKCGLTSLGDMVCEAFGEIVIRGYASQSGDAHGLVYAGTVGQFAYEFNTHFTDGSSLTTSINPGQSRPDLESTHVCVPGASVEQLFEKHRAGVAKRTKRKVKPAKHGADLAALAARIDEFLVRTAA